MNAAYRLAGVAGLCTAVLALAGCAGPLAGIETACELVPGETRCSRASVETALLPEAQADDADYNRHFLALLAEQKIGEADRANGTGPFGRDFRSLPNRDFQAAYRALEKAADISGLQPSAGSAATGVFSARWRVSSQTLFVDAGNLDARPAEFQFSGLHARSVEIRLVNIGERPAALSGRCDGTIVVGRGGRVIAAGEPVRLSLSKAEVPGSSAVLYPGPDLNRCELTVRSQGAARRLTILREEVADPQLARFDSLYQRCPSPDPARLSPLERAFYANRELSETCPMPIGKPRLLLGERDGFNAKVEALAGSRLPDSFFEKADPEAPIDLSRAPKLKLIYFSYLDFKADFSGRVMERLIRHHAARGAKVRITVTAVLERKKDRALLRRMAADYPNIQLQEFSWDPATGAPVGEQLSRFYKTHHVKMLATIANDPRRSRAIIGGRNIHDGFLFHDPVDLSRYPNLHQYDETKGLSLNYYSNWSDFEIEFTAAKLVETLTAHMATLWHRDAKTNLSRPFSIAGKVSARPVPEANSRHFISVPYADGRALEDHYVELIDAAAETIDIVNPYLNLTPKLADAFGRALDRGVKVTMVTRIDLKGDFGGKFLTALNQLFVEQYAGRIAMYEFRAPEVLLHAKIMMIDGSYVSISSVNLNNRSFIQDSENGIAVLDRAFYKRMRPIFDSHVARSRPIDLDVHVPLAYRLLFSAQHVDEAF